MYKFIHGKNHQKIDKPIKNIAKLIKINKVVGQKLNFLYLLKINFSEV